MPKVSLISSLNRSIHDLAILSNFNLGSKALDAKYQYLISEVILLRLFSVLECTISEVAFKLACGATYRNGNNPIVLRQCSSIHDSFINMISYNRRKPLHYLQWTKATFVRTSIEHILDINDSYYANIQNHSNLINEMRVVRNHIAHRSTSTKQEYDILLQQIYGGNPKLTIGTFLTTTNRNPISNIDRYIASTRIILDDITNG